MRGDGERITTCRGRLLLASRRADARVGIERGDLHGDASVTTPETDRAVGRFARFDRDDRSARRALDRFELRFVERIAAALKPGGRFVMVTSYMPAWYSRSYILSRAFNVAMHVRNVIKRPPFVMFYLTFLLPQAKRLLEQHGFEVVVHEDAFEGNLRALKLVVATKRE